MRKKIIDSVKNEDDETYTRKLHYSFTDFLKNSFNPQNNIFNSQDNYLLSSNYLTNLKSSRNDINNNNNIAINVHDNDNNNENTQIIRLPTYQESFRISNVNNRENEKNNTESIVEANALEQTVEEYYERVRRVPRRNLTNNTNSANINGTNTENDHAIAEAVYENEKQQYKNNEKNRIEENNKKQTENIIDDEIVQIRDENYNRVQRSSNTADENSNCSQENNTENNLITTETTNENRNKQNENIIISNLRDIINRYVDDSEILSSYNIGIDENEQDPTENIILNNSNEQESNKQKFNIIELITDDNQKELHTENETTKLNTQSIVDEMKNNTKIVITRDLEEAKRKSSLNNIISLEPFNLEKLDKQNQNDNIHIVHENRYVYSLSLDMDKSSIDDENKYNKKNIQLSEIIEGNFNISNKNDDIESTIINNEN